MDPFNWSTASGEPCFLPVRLETAEIVDPVPARQWHDQQQHLHRLDCDGQVIVSHHKFDSAGNTQIYIARFKSGQWTRAQVTHWDNFRWDFGGPGSPGVSGRNGRYGSIGPSPPQGGFGDR